MRKEDEEHNRRQGDRIILWKGATLGDWCVSCGYIHVQIGDFCISCVFIEIPKSPFN